VLVWREILGWGTLPPRKIEDPGFSLSTQTMKFLSLYAVLNATLKDCSSGTSLFTVNMMSLDPPNPAPGQQVGFTLDYSVPPSTVITDGTARYETTYNFIPLAPTIQPLCSNIPCPLESGRYLNTTYSMWPTGLSGTIMTRMKWLDPTGTMLICTEISGKV